MKLLPVHIYKSLIITSLDGKPRSQHFFDLTAQPQHRIVGVGEGNDNETESSHQSTLSTDSLREQLLERLKHEKRKEHLIERLQKKSQPLMISSLTSALRHVLGARMIRKFEYYLLETKWDEPKKLPFDQPTLRRMVKELVVPEKTWIDYLSMDVGWRQSVDSFRLTLNKAHNRPRKCEGVHLYDNPSTNDAYLLVFFSLGKPIKPIYLRTPNNGAYEFTFASCSSWDVGFQ